MKAAIGLLIVQAIIGITFLVLAIPLLFFGSSYYTEYPVLMSAVAWSPFVVGCGVLVGQCEFLRKRLRHDRMLVLVGICTTILSALILSGILFVRVEVFVES